MRVSWWGLVAKPAAMRIAKHVFMSAGTLPNGHTGAQGPQKAKKKWKAAAEDAGAPPKPHQTDRGFAVLRDPQSARKLHLLACPA